MGVPPNGGFIGENPIKINDLGVPPFQETPICPGVRNFSICLNFGVMLQLLQRNIIGDWMNTIYLQGCV